MEDPDNVAAASDPSPSHHNQNLTPVEFYNKLEYEVIKDKPILSNILRNQGKVSVFDFIKQWPNSTSVPDNRKNNLLDTFEQILKQSLGDVISANARKYLSAHYRVSTAEHHGPICHPFNFTSHLLSSAVASEEVWEGEKFSIGFSCANISMHNSSFPRGLIYTKEVNGKPSFTGIPFFPRSSVAFTVSGFRPYNSDDIERMLDFIKQKNLEGELSQNETDKLIDLTQDVFCSNEAFNQVDYTDQVTRNNYYYWKRLLSNTNKTPASLIYLPQEKIVTQLLIDFHLNTNTEITEWLFGENSAEWMYELFEGIICGFNRQNQYGTYMFWGFPKNAKYRTAMWLEDGYLISTDKTFKVAWSKESVLEALKTGELVPGSLLELVLLSGYYGLNCLGGFSQINYLTEMMDSYKEFLTRINAYSDNSFIDNVVTSVPGGDFTTAFINTPSGSLISPTSIDWLFHNDINSWDNLITSSKTLPMKLSLAMLMPDFYRVVYTQDQRNKYLNQITPDMIAEALELKKFCKPLFTI